MVPEISTEHRALVRMEMEKAKVKQRGTVDDEFLFAVEEISME
jgi:hypothetical protein